MEKYALAYRLGLAFLSATQGRRRGASVALLDREEAQRSRRSGGRHRGWRRPRPTSPAAGAAQSSQRELDALSASVLARAVTQAVRSSYSARARSSMVRLGEPVRVVVACHLQDEPARRAVRRGHGKGTVMYSRVITVDSDAGRVEELIRFVRDEVQPAVQAQPGSLGLALFVTGDRGRLSLITSWRTSEDRAASATALAPLREQATQIVGAAPQVQEYELAVLHRDRPVVPGCWLRVTRVQADPARVQEGVDTYRERVLPVVRDLPGFHSAALLVDPTSGAALSATAWESREALDASRAPTESLRSDPQPNGARVLDVTDYEVLIAGLRPPNQHETLFRRAYAAMSAGGDLDDLDAVIAPDIVDHAPLPPGTPPGLAGVKHLLAAYREAFPDLQLRLEKYLEQDDSACAVLRITGTHTGPLMGMPATGRAMDVMAVDVARVADGKAVEHWGLSDDLGMFAQLGLVQLPGQQAGVPEQQQKTSQVPTSVNG